jgi:hypothetical protein
MTATEKLVFIAPQLIWCLAALAYLCMVSCDYYCNRWSKEARKQRKDFEAFRRKVLFGDDNAPR